MRGGRLAQRPQKRGVARDDTGRSLNRLDDDSREVGCPFCDQPRGALRGVARPRSQSNGGLSGETMREKQDATVIRAGEHNTPVRPVTAR